MRRSLLALLVLTGCIHYVPRPVDPAANARAIESRRLDDPALRAYAEKSLGWPMISWPPPYWDLNLLTAAAFYFNPDIAVARAEHAAALAAITTARQRPNPTATASIEHKATPELTPWVSSFGFDVPLELPAKRRARVEQAIANGEALRARITVTGWGVRSRLRGDLLDIWAAQQRLSVLRRELEIERDIVEIFTKRLELGEAAQPELARARIAVAQTTLLIEDNRRLEAERRAAVAGVVAVPLEALDGKHLDVLEFGAGIAPIGAELRDEALLGRADVLAALHDYAAAEAALRLEVARQYPDLHLGPAFGWDQGARTWAIAASAELPIVNRHRGEIAEAAARRGQSAARLTALQASIISAFDLARTQLDAARHRLAEVNALFESEARQQATAQKQFEAGEIDRLALRSTELEVFTAVLARIDAEVDLQRAAGAIEDALQRPLTGRTPQLEEQR